MELLLSAWPAAVARLAANHALPLAAASSDYEIKLGHESITGDADSGGRLGVSSCSHHKQPLLHATMFVLLPDQSNRMLPWVNRNECVPCCVLCCTVILLLQVDEEDRPVEPPRILSVDVSWNPFEDIVPRMTAEERAAEEQHK